MDIESHNVYAMAKGLGIPAGMRWKMIRRTSRDNARTPMQWTGGENGGFTTGKPWLQVNKNHTHINVEKDTADPAGVFSFWQYMIGLRKTLPALIDGDFVPVHTGASVFAFERVLDGKRLLAVFNMCGKAARLPKPLRQWKKVVAANYDDLSYEKLKPFEFRLMEEDV